MGKAWMQRQQPGGGGDGHVGGGSGGIGHRPGNLETKQLASMHSWGEGIRAGRAGSGMCIGGTQS